MSDFEDYLELEIYILSVAPSEFNFLVSLSVGYIEMYNSFYCTNGH